jgi:hypothetical protein
MQDTNNLTAEAILPEAIPTPPKRKKVSFSQFSMWYKCPRQYSLNYIHGHRKTDLNLNIFFGTAMHRVLQLYIETLYTKGVVEAESIPVYDMFKDAFTEEVTKEKDKFTYTPEEFDEFAADGVQILNTFLSPRNRLKYFPTNAYEFVGVEVPLDLPIRNNVDFIAYVDLILKDKKTNRYKIFDIKTSSVGWNMYAKEDQAKISQVLLYKAFYSKKFNVKLSDIDVEFFIVKRKLYENVDFPQSRIQTFEPPHSNAFISEVLSDFTKFVTECFTDEGNYIKDKVYQKIPGKNKKNCKWCAHYKTLCDGKEKTP